MHLFVERENVDVIAVKLHISFISCFKSFHWTLKMFFVHKEVLLGASKSLGLENAHSWAKF